MSTKILPQQDKILPDSWTFGSRFSAAAIDKKNTCCVELTSASPRKIQRSKERSKKCTEKPSTLNAANMLREKDSRQNMSSYQGNDIANLPGTKSKYRLDTGLSKEKRETDVFEK